MSSQGQDVAAVIDRLQSQDINVVRVSYSDMIGIDRGRDVLLSELAAALGHGLPFSRCVYHTSPMGDVVQIQGGVEAGLPDIHVVPDLSTLAPLPWEPGAMTCLGDTFLADGTLAPESPRTVVSRVAEHLAQLNLRAVVGPELEYFVCEPDGSAGTGFTRYANSPGNVYVVGRKGDPKGLLLRTLRYLREAGLHVTAANHEFCAGQFEINL